ncbi:complex I subunit 5 family protein [Marinospirillum sp.]|uniref:complex I subunit 5 family protein n=1 Tax=Marinospirillum sp. TaxID=2183934 RepID=UPI003A87EEB1
MSTHLIPWLVMLPLVWALAGLATPRRWAQALAFLFILLQGLVLLAISLEGWGQQVHLGGWAPPLGIALRMEGVTHLLLWLTWVVMSFSALHASHYLIDYPRAQVYFWPLFAFCWSGLNVVWLSGDLFNLYVGLELLGLSSVGLIALTGQKEALGASLRYLYAALLGSLAYLLGVGLLYGAYGTLDLHQLSQQLTLNPLTWMALASMTLGLLLKTAIFPLHTWLPPAHARALPPVSALLSGLVAKASFVILVRLWLELVWPQASEEALLYWLGQGLGALGAGAILWGGWMAWRQDQLKPLVAYSTVAQLGYLMLVFPLIFGATSQLAVSLAWEGLWMQLLAHGLAKAAMFLAAGNLVLAMGQNELKGLHGVGRHLPFSLLGFGLAGVSLMGLPPSGGFTAKWLMLHSALISGQGWWIAILLLGSLLSALYIFKVFHFCFTEESDEGDHFHHPSIMLDLSALLLALGALALGLASYWPITWMQASCLGGFAC